jgi:hypothetical protein
MRTSTVKRIALIVLVLAIACSLLGNVVLRAVELRRDYRRLMTHGLCFAPTLSLNVTQGVPTSLFVQDTGDAVPLERFKEFLEGVSRRDGDGDGLSLAAEILQGTSDRKRDTDGDGLADAIDPSPNGNCETLEGAVEKIAVTAAANAIKDTGSAVAVYVLTATGWSAPEYRMGGRRVVNVDPKAWTILALASRRVRSSPRVCVNNVVFVPGLFYLVRTEATWGPQEAEWRWTAIADIPGFGLVRVASWPWR